MIVGGFDLTGFRLVMHCPPSAAVNNQIEIFLFLPFLSILLRMNDEE